MLLSIVNQITSHPLQAIIWPLCPVQQEEYNEKSLKLCLYPLTGSEAFLEEADLFAERVDAIQLLEGVGQEAGFLRHALVQRHGEQTGERGQDQLELLER